MTERLPLHPDAAPPTDKRVDDLLSRLTLDERIALLHQFTPGVERVGFAAFRTGQEALHGVAWMGPATVFPQSVGLGATWNDDLVRRIGDAVSAEVRAMRERDDRIGLNVWAPTVNLLRHPLWGRNEEGYSEDPHLTAAIATAYTRGLRGTHPTFWRTAPVLKHWLAHNNETLRDTSNSCVRPRVLHEYDLKAFRAPVEAGAVAGVMPAYNLVNGRPNHVSPHLREQLRTWTGQELLVCSDSRRAQQPRRLRALLRHPRGGHRRRPRRGRRQLHRPRHRLLDDHRADPPRPRPGPDLRIGHRHRRTPTARCAATPGRVRGP